MRARICFVALALVACRDFHVRARRPDAAVPADAPDTTEDAGAEGSAPPPPRWCAGGTATFCDDFDVGELGASWTRQVVRGAPALAFETAEVRSAPHALLVRDEGGGAGERRAYLERRFAERAADVHAGCELAVSALEGDGFNAVAVTEGNLAAVLAVYPSSTVLRLEVLGGASEVTPLTIDVTPGAFRRVELDVSFTTRRVRVDVGGQPAADAPMPAAASSAGGEPLTLEVGIVYTTGAGRVTARFDDVSFTAR